MPHSLLVADLHLCPERPDITATFLRFLREVAAEAQALYILGDLFEYWPGDDALTDPYPAEVSAALASLTSSGTALFILHGNRDFLLGDGFARASGAHFLSDPCPTALHGFPVLLTHGDTLCSDDMEYLRFREEVRSAAWRKDFLARPLAERKAMIESWRRESEVGKQQKPPALMDANPQAVEEMFREYGYPCLIHGHTHRGGRHPQVVDGRACERWVLDAWYEGGSYLRCDREGCVAHPFP